MADKKLEQKQQAQYLYMAEGRTQKEIAGMVGVSERTVHTWIHMYSWNKLRLAAMQAPATIADNLCSQLVELQNTIAAREPGKRFPTQQEPELTRKLITGIEKMKKYPSLAQNMQILETFRNYMRPVDKDFTRKLSGYTERFLSAKAVNGFAPYQIEYGVDAVSPYYEETEGPEPEQLENLLCPDINTCLHPGNCSWPHCKHGDVHAEPVDKYRLPQICYTYSPAQPAIHVQPPAEATGSIPAISAIEDETGNTETHVTDNTIDSSNQPPLAQPGTETTGSIPAKTAIEEEPVITKKQLTDNIGGSSNQPPLAQPGTETTGSIPAKQWSPART